jgi:integrase/recombinase XerC/integrase/recombinase XerD
MKKTFKEISENFLSDLDVKGNSRNTYRNVLLGFEGWVKDKRKDMRNLKRPDIIAYKECLLSKSENTVGLYLTVIRRFFEYAADKGEHENIAAGITIKGKKTMHRREHLTIDEVKRLLSNIDTKNLIGKRNYAIINIMLRSGMRCVELSRLRVCDITYDENDYSILIQRKGENSRTQTLGLTRKALFPVMEYLDLRGVSARDEPVFMTHAHNGEHGMCAMRIGRIVKQQLLQAGIDSPRKTAHSLRHTTAVMAIMNKVPVRDVQLLLGHRNIETTEIYLKSIDDAMRKSNTVIRTIDELF